MKKFSILLAALFLFSTGCSVGNIDISRRETPTQPQMQQIIENGTAPSNANSESTGDGNVQNVQLDLPYSEVPETAKLGERFCVINPVSSGHFYITLNKCEVYDSLNDAGIKYDDMRHSLVIEGLSIDPQTSELLNSFKMIMIQMTIENVDAVSYDHLYQPDEFGEYDFFLGRIGNVSGAVLEYLDIHFDNKHYTKVHIEPGETKDIVVGYALCTDDVPLEDAVFRNGDENSPKDFPYTVVDLELGE